MSNIVVDAEPSAPVEQESTTNETVVSTAAVTEEVAPEAGAVESSPAEYVIPDKFAGKSTEEIIDSYQNLEKEMGRKAQEVGELRKLSDSFLQAQINTNQEMQNPQAEVPQEQEVDFFEDPNLAVNKAIEHHPKFREFQQFQAQQVQASAQAHLEQTHPDFTSVVADSKFQDWVKESPIRTQLFVSADQEYNYDAANELLSTWKDRSMINKTQEVEAQAEADRQAALKAGTTESRTSAGSSDSGKSFRRADLIRMKIENPSQYESMQDEIYAAYAAGRVK